MTDMNYRKSRAREKGGHAKSSDINCNRLFHDTKGHKHQIHRHLIHHYSDVYVLLRRVA